MSTPRKVDPRSVPSITLDTTVAKTLESIVSQAADALSKARSGQEIEFEFRLGRPRNLDNRNHQWFFDSTIEYDTWEQLKARLHNARFPVRHTWGTITTKEIDSRSRLRLIETQFKLESSEIVSKMVIQRKNTLAQPVDQVVLIGSPITPIETSNRNVYMMRFALSSEDQESDQEYRKASSPAQIRKRERYSYSLPDYGIIDLTIVDEKEYSVEFEYSRPFLASLIGSPILRNRAELFSNHLLPPIKHVFRLLWPDTPIITNIHEITEAYFQLIDISTNKSQLNDIQPANIAEKDVPNLRSGYEWTNKLNGTRYRLMFTQQGSARIPVAYLVSRTDLRFVGSPSSELVKQIDDKIKLWDGTLIDVELFISTKHRLIDDTPIQELHAFDCPVFAGKSQTLESHNVRLGKLNMPISAGQTLVDAINTQVSSVGYSFELKRFFPNLTDTVRYMFSRYGTDTERDNDGLVMQPTGKDQNGKNKAYYDRSYPIYKWKWPNTVSIDFKLEEIEAFDRDGIHYRVFNLLVSDQRKLVKFGPFTRDGKYYNPPSVLLVPISSPHADQLKSGQIVELGFDRPSNSFIVNKIRDDKTEPNALIPTAQATFVDMYSEFTLERLKNLLGEEVGPQTRPNVPIPVSKESVETKCLETYRSYHNRIKTGIIQAYARDDAEVVDLGAGRGGDLRKFFHANIRRLWAVEPNLEFINGPENFRHRLDKIGSESKAGNQWTKNVEIIHAGAEQLDKISSAVATSRGNKDSTVPVITSFFSASFFYQSPSMFETIIHTIDTLLSVGGKFVGTMIDGQRVYDALKPSGEITDPCYKIRAGYNPETTKTLDFGLPITINLDTATVIGDQTEWLSPFNVLQKALSLRNIELVETMFLDDPRVWAKFPRPNSRFPETEAIYKQLTAGQQRLNSFYRYFVFEKKAVNAKKLAEEARAAKKLELEKNQLDLLSQDKSELFTVPIYSKPVYRVGTLGDGSCYFHSILFLLINQKYISLKNKARKALVAQVRNALADALSPEMYSILAGGQIELLNYFPLLQQELKSALIANVLSAGDQPGITNAELTIALEAAASESSSIAKQIEQINSSLTKYGFEPEDIAPIIRQARLEAWEEFRTSLRNCATYVDHNAIEYTMLSLKRNIFIIDDQTRLPVLFTACSNYNPDWSSLVVLRLVGSEHFEAVVDLESDSSGEITNTVFSWPWSNPFIQALYQYVCSAGK